MSLSKADKEFIQLTVQNAIAPIKEQNERFSQTLYGVNMDNGIVSQIEDLITERDGNRQKMWKTVGIINGIWIVVLALHDVIMSALGLGPKK